MAERAPKRCSYPSTQRREGPAPLASFEDLSDEIESPTEKNCHPLPEIEEELKLHADAATPSTPRVLDASSTPSPLTPGADLSSTITPRVDSFPPSWDEGATTGGSAEFSHEGSRQSLAEEAQAAAPLQVTFQVLQPPPPVRERPRAANLKNSKSSSFMDDVRGAEAAEALASSLPERAATPECLPRAAPNKKSSLTSGQSSRTPSRTPSPNSPRRFFSFFKHRDESEPGSPASPKSPRKTSFTNLFKLGGRKSPDERAVSPNSRKGSLSLFFKGGKDKEAAKMRRTPEEAQGPPQGPVQGPDKGQKEATNRNVFSSLFKKAGDKKLAQVKLTLQATSVDVPVEIASTGWTSREISLHSHLCDLLDDEEPLELPSEPSEPSEVAALANGKHEEAVEVYVDAKGPVEEAEEEAQTVAAAFAAQERRSKRPLDRGDAVVGEEEGSKHPGSLSEVKVGGKSTSDERISSGSEQETDFDPVSLKKRPTSEDYEVETLITEESGEYEEYAPVPPPQSSVAERRAAPPIRRQRLVDMTTTPIDRPRSSTPLSVTSIEAFMQTASPPPERAQADAEPKLKVSLPGEEFGGRGRSPRKMMAVKNWQDFCQEALHSPRARRKDEEEVATTSWVTFENAPEVARAPEVSEKRVSEADLERSDLMFDSRRFSPTVGGAEECKCECHKVKANGVKTPPADASSQTSCGATWARDRATQMPSQEGSVEERRSRSTQMPSQDSVSLEAPRRSATVESTSSGEVWGFGDSLDGRDPLLLVSNGSEESECEHDTTGEFTDAHTCSEHSTSPSTGTFDRCHVFFPHNGDDRNGI